MMTPHKILIVEDSELLHRMYEVVFHQFRSAGGALLHAMNGREALNILAQNADVDLILLDINMPVMSGLEFLHHCKREQVFRHIPVIVISTEGKRDDTIRALEAGARGYVTKPFRPPELHALIERVCSAEHPAAPAGVLV
jgi:two-component system, chemotaxis family, chemotaxis protein CheY